MELSEGEFMTFVGLNLIDEKLQSESTVTEAEPPAGLADGLWDLRKHA